MIPVLNRGWILWQQQKHPQNGTPQPQTQSSIYASIVNTKLTENHISCFQANYHQNRLKSGSLDIYRGFPEKFNNEKFEFLETKISGGIWREKLVWLGGQNGVKKGTVNRKHKWRITPKKISNFSDSLKMKFQQPYKSWLRLPKPWSKNLLDSDGVIFMAFTIPQKKPQKHDNMISPSPFNTEDHLEHSNWALKWSRPKKHVKKHIN